MILFVLSTIFSILGIYGFYSDNYTLLIIGTVIVLIETIILSHFQKTNFTTIVIGIIVGIICTNNIFTGFAIGICYESLINSLLSLIMVIIESIHLRKK